MREELRKHQILPSVSSNIILQLSFLVFFSFVKVPSHFNNISSSSTVNCSSQFIPMSFKVFTSSSSLNFPSQVSNQLQTPVDTVVNSALIRCIRAGTNLKCKVGRFSVFERFVHNIVGNDKCLIQYSRGLLNPVVLPLSTSLLFLNYLKPKTYREGTVTATSDMCRNA